MEDREKLIGEMNRRLAKMMEEANLASREDFDNLSSTDIYNLLYGLFGEKSIVQFTDELTAEECEQIPFLKLFHEYLIRVNTLGELKLTGKGNLPKRLCLELYDLGIIKEDFIERGIVKLHRESDSIVIQNVKILGDLSGLTKKRNNKTSLTRRGHQFFKDGNSYNLLVDLFQANISKFNWGYHDGYDEEQGIQQLFGYTMYLLLRYGKEKRLIDFYVEKNLKAFPQLLDEFEEGYRGRAEQYRSCYFVRVFERLLDYYGFVEIDKIREQGSFIEKIEVKTTPIFRKVFKLDKGNYKFRKPRHVA